MNGTRTSHNLALYASMVVSMLTSSFTGLARAQTRKNETHKRGAPAQISGFAQIESDLTRSTLEMKNAWVISTFRPRDNMTALIVVNFAGAPKLLEAAASIKLGNWPFRITAGQFTQRSAFLVPPPRDEPLIGGPLLTKHLTVQDIGLEASGTHAWFSWSLAALSGTGKNEPDNNPEKDVLAWMALGPFGPLRFQLAWQAGKQPNGFRMRSAGQFSLQIRSFTIDVAGVHERFATTDTLGFTGTLAVRAHKYLDLALGYDSLVVNGSPANRMVRTQATFLAFDDSVRVGLMYRHQREDHEHAVIGHIQVNF